MDGEGKEEVEGGGRAHMAGPSVPSGWASRYVWGGTEEVVEQGAMGGQMFPGQYMGGRWQQQQQQQEPGNSPNGVGLQDGRQEQSAAVFTNGAMDSDEERPGGRQADSDARQYQKLINRERKRLREQKRHAEQQGQQSGGGSSSKQRRST
eukprot:79988-Pelagomonas_calceolata.AAC.1